jgi:1-deoxy-D-xylulose-5-phosphate reductoisomerase
MKKKISILGSTGSIGLSALSIINKKKNFFSINILVANKNFNLICKQLKLYKPNIFIISDFNTFKKVSKKFKGRKIRILNNYNLLKKKSDSSDITISAIPGIAGLEPTIKFIELSKKILIANK